MAGTILCVDDDRHFCQILSRALSQSGWQVEMVHDGERALGRIRELSPALVTLDVLTVERGPATGEKPKWIDEAVEQINAAEDVG